MSTSIPTIVAAIALLSVAACGDADPPAGERTATGPVVSQPGPAATPPDTSVMGAGRDPTAIEKVDDGSIVARLKGDFAADPDISAMAVDIDSKGGMVTLSGVVTNSEAKVRADKLARSLPEVKSVNNQLEVKAG